MIVELPVSIGELIDKISILLIKKNNIKDQNKIIYIDKELLSLQKILNDAKLNSNKIDLYLQQLNDINSKLWDIEDRIRDFEKNNVFDKNFIELARSVYKNNDIRAKIKKNINKEFNSEIIEVKSYHNY